MSTGNMNRHADGSSPQANVLTAEYVDRNALVGPAGTCVGRLKRMMELGIQRFVFLVTARNADRAEADRSLRLLADEVLPALH